MSRLLRGALTVAVGIFVVVALWNAATRPDTASPEQAAREISQGLRCPTCAGESIADSNALLSDAMRQTVRDQVEQGRSPDEVREWFAERYGDEVLLEPPRRGYGWLMWILPLGMVAVTAIVLLHRSRVPGRWPVAALAGLAIGAATGVWVFGSTDDYRGAPHEFSDAQEHKGANDSPESHDMAVTVLQDAVQDEPGSTERRLALATALEKNGDTAGAASAYSAVVRLQPLDPDVRYRYAFSLVRNGEVDAAVEVLDETLSFADSHAPSLLLLGSLLHEEQPDRAEQLLQRFAELQPDHPATDQVTDVLDDASGG